VIGAIADVDDGTRTELAVGRPPQVDWPHGRALDVIVRGAMREGAQIWVFPGRLTDTPLKTRADVEQLARTSTSFAIAMPHPIGATATPAGRELYLRGDRHAVITGNRQGWSSACVAPDERPSTTVSCVAVDVAAGEVTDLPDGRWGTEPQAALIELR
jgi:hypothetical protein